MRSYRVMLAVLSFVFVLGMLAMADEAPISSAGEIEGLSFIPAGSFMMGDTFGEGCVDELPVHKVTLSAYYIGSYEVTNDEMVEVLQWAYDHDLITVTSSDVENLTGDRRDLLHIAEEQCRITWDGETFGIKDQKGSGYPCVEVSWFGAVAYCNYRSEMEGLTPCYDLSDWSCDWTADGYRLPTNAEWERAARGGAEGRRFPWADTDTIDQSRANYRSSGDQIYDLTRNSGQHPTYGVGEFPYTSPVGSFPPNGYGLYDTAGNVWEWCWDYWSSDYYTEEAMTDPRGPDSGGYRVVRSGRWGYDAAMSRVSSLRHGWPGGRLRMGFRIARSADL